MRIFNRTHRITIICLAFLLKITAPYHVCAQDRTEPDISYSFKVIVPDGPITQGDQIDLEYILDANSYLVTTFDGGIKEGKRIKLVNSESELPGGMHRLSVTATYQISSFGTIKVRPMSAKVYGKTVYSDSTTIIVQPNTEYGFEWNIAREFLQNKGAETNELKYRFGTETLLGFSDNKSNVFAIVARKKYESNLNNPILAYSLESPLWKSTDTESSVTLSQIINNYEQQLKELQANDSVYSGTHISEAFAENSKNGSCLLQERKYGQTKPFNDLFPIDQTAKTETRCVAGCGPVALAHVLSYYRVKPQSTISGFLHFDPNQKISINMTDYPIDWSETDSDHANLMINCAASLASSVSSSSSTTNMNNFKSALISYWNYDPQCLYTSNVSDMELLTLSYSELNDNRPVIVGGQNHIFVCDGYDQDYLHFNFGWNGNCNGYYRVLVDNETSNRLPFNEILTGIEPLKEMQSDTVTVQEPGTLSTLIDANNRNKITSLTVNGTINGDDINFLRNLAGAIDVYNPSKGIGSLMNLDLSEAKINGGMPYAVFYADGYIISGKEPIPEKGVFSYSYNLSDITDSQWKTIVNYKLDDRGDMFLERDSTGRIYISYHTKDNDVIGNRMFADCQNLRTIILPHSTLRIDEDAFYNCRSLQQVNNLPAKVSKKAFRECRLYEK